MTVPMSRPSSTAPPGWWAKARWRSSSAARTAGWIETRLARLPVSSLRRIGSASSASGKAQPASASASQSGSPPLSATFRPTAR